MHHSVELNSFRQQSVVKENRFPLLPFGEDMLCVSGETAVILASVLLHVVNELVALSCCVTASSWLLPLSPQMALNGPIIFWRKIIRIVPFEGGSERF